MANDDVTRSPLTVVVASRNPAKIRAVSEAFRSQFPQHELSIDGIDADSGISDQPVGDDETRRGARNRLASARAIVTDADFWVGLEGGIARIGDSLVAFAWMAVGDRDGRVGEARSATLPLPPAVGRLIDSGLELGDANDRVFATLRSKEQGGAFGLLTGGRHTRESVYAQTVLLALVPLVHPLFTDDAPSPAGAGGQR